MHFQFAISDPFRLFYLSLSRCAILHSVSFLVQFFAVAPTYLCFTIELIQRRLLSGVFLLISAVLPWHSDFQAFRRLGYMGPGKKAFITSMADGSTLYFHYF
ncbi:MAG: hypothetical protein FRX48_05391 [Lasallia pustulata]|uniref:Uncharacterized protein n=1 Tax=Lasallia pustulata TaxID=136370 RepID=A0A5M8PQ89_9LECA|nr:MAG: hypothetical protein FRX48_05391 [Lasallia pustulata]